MFGENDAVIALHGAFRWNFVPSLMLTLSRSLRRTAAKPALMHRGSLCSEDEQRCSWLHAYGTEDKADYRHVLMVMEREDECSRDLVTHRRNVTSNIWTHT